MGRGVAEGEPSPLPMSAGTPGIDASSSPAPAPSCVPGLLTPWAPDTSWLCFSSSWYWDSVSVLSRGDRSARRGMSPRHLPSPVPVWPCPLLSFPAHSPPAAGPSALPNPLSPCRGPREPGSPARRGHQPLAALPDARVTLWLLGFSQSSCPHPVREDLFALHGRKNQGHV